MNVGDLVAWGPPSWFRFAVIVEVLSNGRGDVRMVEDGKYVTDVLLPRAYHVVMTFVGPQVLR